MSDLPPTLVALFRRAAARGGDRPFLWAKADGAYRPWSWQRIAAEVDVLCRSLLANGVAPGDRVLLVSENRPEWLIADLAILSAGAITVPAYTTNMTGDHAHLLGDSGASAVIVSNAATAAQLLPALAGAPAVRLLLAMEPLPQADSLSIPVLSWAEAAAAGADAADPAPDPADRLKADDIACIVYTSGTGGKPRGVMLSHGNILANVAGARNALQTIGLADQVFLSFLPLSHAYEHTAGQFLPIAIDAEIYYAQGIETLSADLVEVRPTIMTCVPRLYEVMHQRIVSAMTRQTGLKPKLFGAALTLGTKAHERPQAMSLAERLANRTLDRLVRNTVKARFGGRMRALVSGGAPLNRKVGMFFTALGLPVFQGYGLTECSPVVSVNLPGQVDLATVGPPFVGTEVRIADDGEILVRGPSVMVGYWGDPAATAAAVRDGWLHTGDVGHLDDAGRITITDRKRDIIVLSGGDSVSPQRVEGIVALEPEIGQVLVFGDRQPHLVALIVADAAVVAAYAKRNGVPPDLSALAEDADFRKVIAAAVARANETLSVIERIRRFRLMPEPFTIENGLLTPTMKLKRTAICRKYRDVIDGLYAAPGEISAGTRTAGGSTVRQA